ncbi:fasciclin domain-containing protein [Nonomuraea diastatica]|uniref:Fasciclin domain-containing protein n=1 Tax=Nonomuraea diastatica TaxID=1848329 RepID=A0A4R4W786_9ACTN|nr:fasciclin domain-containing protein [Nonomuraea diastatica]TDD14538.1 fasciclin domain-containing protein [Nonomuraea diastatica]
MLLAAALALTASTAGMTGASAHSPTLSSPVPSPDSSPGTSPDTSPGPGGAPIGPGCSALESSLPNIADQTAATALSEVPDLSSLDEAVQEAGLADRLDQAEALTIFAPDNKAFEAIPQDARDQLMGDNEELTRVLTYHVVEGKKTPADLEEEGTLTSLEGGELEVKGSGENLTINDAKLVCGGVQTKNATIYVIDKVLMPE